MASYLVAKVNTVTKSYTLKTTEPSKPYLKVSNSYLPLTTQTKTGLQVKVNDKSYNIQESYTTTKQSSATSVVNIAYNIKTNTTVNTTLSYRFSTSVNFFGKQINQYQATYRDGMWNTYLIYNYHNFEETIYNYFSIINTNVKCIIVSSYRNYQNTISTCQDTYTYNTNVFNTTYYIAGEFNTAGGVYLYWWAKTYIHKALILSSTNENNCIRFLPYASINIIPVEFKSSYISSERKIYGGTWWYDRTTWMTPSNGISSSRSLLSALKEVISISTSSTTNASYMYITDISNQAYSISSIYSSISALKEYKQTITKTYTVTTTSQ